MASLEVQYSTHRLTCGLLISGSDRAVAIIPRCFPVFAVLAGTDLARGSCQLAEETKGQSMTPFTRELPMLLMEADDSTHQATLLSREKKKGHRPGMG
ncbi:MAG: hypothetical protein JOZ09_00765 [Pseudonocardiales bacterium]|nr:hypothetical protein [Pseudonocardiales bacterium]